MKLNKLPILTIATALAIPAVAIGGVFTFDPDGGGPDPSYVVDSFDFSSCIHLQATANVFGHLPHSKR